MYGKRTSGVALAALFVLTGACSDSTGPAENELSVDELAFVALDGEEAATAILDAELIFMGAAGVASAAASAEPMTRTRDFNRSRPCPQGGHIELTGTVTRTFDPETRVMEADFEGTRLWQQCQHLRNEHTYTINGTGDFEAFRRRVEGQLDGPQTSSATGSFTITRDDGEGKQCDFDVSVVLDPEAMTRTITGTVCGREIDRTVTWSHGG